MSAGDGGNIMEGTGPGGKFGDFAKRKASVRV